MNHKPEQVVITFDKDIPVPRLRVNRKYSFELMGVGDSFVGGPNDGNALHSWCRAHGWEFTRRATGQPGQWRFWRVA